MRIGWVLLSIGLFVAGCSKPDRYVLQCALGDIELEVYPARAPITVKNFKRYVKQSDFSGAEFFRVVHLDNQPDDSIKIEVIQGSFIAEERAFDPIAHETTDETGILHKDGVVSMARLAPGTAAWTFFICVNDQPALDYGGKRNPDGQGFAAFGKVVKGMDVVRAIQRGATDHQTLVEPVPIYAIRRL